MKKLKNNLTNSLNNKSYNIIVFFNNKRYK